MTSHCLPTLAWRMFTIPAWAVALRRQWPHLVVTPATAQGD